MRTALRAFGWVVCIISSLFTMLLAATAVTDGILSVADALISVSLLATCALALLFLLHRCPPVKHTKAAR